MSTYICYHCGQPVNLLRTPSKERKCPHCGRRLHVCENCRFDDVSGCIFGGGGPFVAEQGSRCVKFQFRQPVAA